MDIKPLTVQPTYLQVVKLIEERVMAAARKAGVGSDVFQTALGVPGNELEDTIVSTVVRLAKPIVVAPEFPPVPAVNELFDLEVDGDLDMASGWKPLGPRFAAGKRTYRCRLLDLGSCANRDDGLGKAEVRANELSTKFQLAPGQACEAFMQKYPHHNGRSVIMAGNEWRGPDRNPHVAYLNAWRHGNWDPNFRGSDVDVSKSYLWLVVEPDA
jgi:hypothetical protein